MDSLNLKSALADIPIYPPMGVRATEKQTAVMRALLSGQSTWDAMQDAVNRLHSIAPKDHDVVIRVSDVTVSNAYFIAPHTFLFEGTNPVGESTWIGLHFSQLVFAVIHRPKLKPEPVVTGFCPHPPSA